MNPSTVLSTKYGNFLVTYHTDGESEAVTLQCGNITTGEPLVRIHSSCLFSEAFNAVDCDCKLQLDESMHQIAERGAGIIVYLYQEGRGVGLANKIRAVEVMRIEGCDTVEAFDKLKFVRDPRSYDLATQALRRQELSKTIQAISNNPRKIKALESAGYEVKSIVPLAYYANKITEDYLRSKQEKLGHVISWDQIKT